MEAGEIWEKELEVILISTTAPIQTFQKQSTQTQHLLLT